MTAATTRKSKPNESRSFPDPSAMRDAVAAPYPPHSLSHKLCNNSPSSTGFHLAYDDSLFLISSDLSYIMPVHPPHAAPTPLDAPSHATIYLRKLILFRLEHDPLDNVKEII